MKPFSPSTGTFLNLESCRAALSLVHTLLPSQNSSALHVIGRDAKPLQNSWPKPAGTSFALTALLVGSWLSRPIILPQRWQYSSRDCRIDGLPSQLHTSSSVFALLDRFSCTWNGRKQRQKIVPQVRCLCNLPLYIMYFLPFLGTILTQNTYDVLRWKWTK